MEITARFTRDLFDHTQDNTDHLVVSLKAPALAWMQKRPQLCVLPAIDLSGSMKGGKLRYAQQSLLKLVDQLADGDFAGLIAFESRVHVLVKPQKVTAELKDQLKATINKLRVMGGTNFSDGMLQAVQAVQHLDLPPTFLKRVIMFTDGHPTEGVVDKKGIFKMLDSNCGSVTVSAFGYGEVNGGTYGGVDPEFLMEFASLGNGNYAYVQNPDDALGAFGKELGGLLSTYATNLEVTVEPVHGHLITKVVSNVKHEEDKITGTVELPVSDILCEETRHFVFETKLAQQGKSFPREATAFNVKVTFSVLTEEGKKESRTLEAKARVRFVKPSEARTSPNPEVNEIVDLHRVIRAQLEAEEQAKQGCFFEAQARMESIANEVKTNGGLHDAAMQTRQRLGSAHAYAQNQGYLRSFAVAGTRSFGSSSVQHEAEAVLRSCHVSLSNSAQEQYANVFKSADPVVPMAPVVSPSILVPVEPVVPPIVAEDPTPPAVLPWTASSTNKSG